MKNDAVFKSGKEGFRRNKSNPFNVDTYSHREWERGYNAAYFENLEKVKAREAKQK